MINFLKNHIYNVTLILLYRNSCLNFIRFPSGQCTVCVSLHISTEQICYSAFQSDVFYTYIGRANQIGNNNQIVSFQRINKSRIIIKQDLLRKSKFPKNYQRKTLLAEKIRRNVGKHKFFPEGWLLSSILDKRSDIRLIKIANHQLNKQFLK